MKSKTLKIVVAVIFIFIAVTASLIISNAIKTKKENLAFQEKYAISSSLAGIYEGKVKIIDYSDGSVEYMSFEEYSDFSGEEIIVQVENDVFSFENGEKTFLFSTEHRARGIFRLGDAVYFEAEEIGDTDPFAKKFLWKLKNGKIEKAIDIPIERGSVLIYGDDLIFSGEGHIVYLYDTKTESRENICAGYSICWKEEGKSFFFCASDGIHLYDLETETSEDMILLKDFGSNDLEINLQYRTIYNEKDKVLNKCVLFHEDFHFTVGLYYLEYDEFVSEREYTYKMEIEREKFLIGYNSDRWLISEPLGWI